MKVHAPAACLDSEEHLDALDLPAWEGLDSGAPHYWTACGRLLPRSAVDRDPEKVTCRECLKGLANLTKRMLTGRGKLLYLARVNRSGAVIYRPHRALLLEEDLLDEWGDR